MRPVSQQGETYLRPSAHGRRLLIQVWDRPRAYEVWDARGVLFLGYTVQASKRKVLAFKGRNGVGKPTLGEAIDRLGKRWATKSDCQMGLEEFLRGKDERFKSLPALIMETVNDVVIAR